MTWLHDEDGLRRAGQTAFRDVKADARAALRSEHPPEWHEARLDRATRSLWRITFVCSGVLIVGWLLDVLGVF